MSDAPPSVPRWLSGAAAVSWRVVIVVAAIWLAGQAFVRLDVVVVPVVAALFIATVLVPPATWMRRHHVPALVATWIVFLAAAAAVVGIVFGVLPGVEHEFSALGRAVTAGIGQTQAWLVSGPFHLSAGQVSSFTTSLQHLISTHRGTLIQGALSGVSVVVSVVAGVLLTIVLTFFFVKDGGAIGAWFCSLFSEGRARDVQAMGRAAWSVLTGYIRGTAVNGLINASVLSLTLLVLRVPFVVPVGLLTFVGGFFPLVGGILSGLVAALVALVAKGPLAGAIVLGATILIHNLEGYLVGPFVLGKAVRLHPVAVLLVLGVGTIVGGALGAFLAVPFTAVVLAVIDHYRGARTSLVVAGAGSGLAGRRPLLVGEVLRRNRRRATPAPTGAGVAAGDPPEAAGPQPPGPQLGEPQIGEPQIGEPQPTVR